MNNAEVWAALSSGEPLFFWVHLKNEQYLVPFICQRCGNCCRKLFDAPCRYLKRTNICEIYDRRPNGCRNFPIEGFGVKW